MNNKKNALIVGATQGIGLGFVKSILHNTQYEKVYATYRDESSALYLFDLVKLSGDKLICLKLDVTDENQVIKAIEKITSKTKRLHLVVNCVGILHEENLQPEKSLKHINSENLLHYFQVNSIPCLLLAKHLKQLFKHQEKNIFVNISAKVGSIEDNRLGGWYGYRASKAALNMFVKTIAIEYSRTNPQTIVISLHPGTTNTRLSFPFQKNVQPEKLFSVELCVNQLLSVINNLNINDTGKFFSWDGTNIPW